MRALQAYGAAVRRYQGQGLVRLDRLDTYECQFEVVQITSGTIVTRLTLMNPDAALQQAIFAEFLGSTGSEHIRLANIEGATTSGFQLVWHPPFFGIDPEWDTDSCTITFSARSLTSSGAESPARRMRFAYLISGGVAAEREMRYSSAR